MVGDASITNPGFPDYAQDALSVQQVLLEQGASAYLFDSPQENVSETIGSGSSSSHTIPAYGSGTLGYVVPNLNDPADFLGASGFLLVSVDAAARDALTNIRRRASN